MNYLGQVCFAWMLKIRVALNQLTWTSIASS